MVRHYQDPWELFIENERKVALSMKEYMVWKDGESIEQTSPDIHYLYQYLEKNYPEDHEGIQTLKKVDDFRLWARALYVLSGIKVKQITNFKR